MMIRTFGMAKNDFFADVTKTKTKEYVLNKFMNQEKR